MRKIRKSLRTNARSIVLAFFALILNCQGAVPQNPSTSDSALGGWEEIYANGTFHADVLARKAVEPAFLRVLEIVAGIIFSVLIVRIALRKVRAALSRMRESRPLDEVHPLAAS